MGYIPEQGDIIFLEKGRRPAFVVSNIAFNQYTKMAIVCPITNTDKGFPLHVSLAKGMQTTGVIMCEQVKPLDIWTRKATFFEQAPKDIIEEVVDILIGFVEI